MSRMNLPEPDPVIIKARDITPGDRLAIYSARRHRFLYERVRRVTRTGSTIRVVTDHPKPITLLHEDQGIKVAPRTRTR